MADVECLRALEHVCAPDPRYALDGRSLELLHAELAALRLHETVPKEVRQQFETAKNLSLYAWFVYRFHPIAAFVARSALEMALREKWKRVYGGEPSKRQRQYAYLLRHAVELRWIRPESFRSMEPLAARRAEERKFHAILAAGVDGEAFSVVPPTGEEVAKEMDALDMPTRLARATPPLRNEAAHGSAMLDGASVGVIRRMGDAINGLFP